ncbi:DUF167 family protein [Nitratireductor sp. GCM10026969]|uniref:DUF167 family protein n=1 Tax=Nitratireductor sp. GCM10026969 TaxID=3252645 RepID=UPI003615BB6F
MGGRPPAFFRATSEGVELRVRLTPKASRDAVEGLETAADGAQHLKMRVRAIPEDGKANAALEKLVAKWLKVPVRDVKLVSGSRSRLKTLSILGDSESLSARLDKIRR